MSNKDHKISVLTAILVNINIMVGAAIYINPPVMTAQVGASSYLTWLFGGLIFLPVVLGITAISKLFPGEGGFYNYAKAGLGNLIGFSTGWMYFLSYTGVCAVQQSALRTILVEKFHIEWIANYPQLFNFIFFFSFAYLSCLHLQSVGRILNFCTLLKLTPLLAVCLLPFILPANPETANLTLSPLDDPNFGLHSLGITIPYAIFGFWGFEACSSISHRIKNNRASMAILLGFVITSLIYTFFHFNLLKIMGPENLGNSKIEDFVHFLPFKSAFLVDNFPAFINISILTAYAVAIYAEFTSCSFLLNAMAKEKLIFFDKQLSQLNKHQQPTYAIFTMAIVAFLFNLVIPKLNVMVALTNISFCFAFVTSLISLSVIYKRKKEWKKQLIPATGLLSCVLVCFYCYNTLDSISDLSFPTLILLLGIGMFLVYQKSEGKKA
ncbi:MAG: amino acid permease [Chlamydiales bacterium]|nr:amino acid permease [Chlamydiales bacterium]